MTRFTRRRWIWPVGLAGLIVLCLVAEHVRGTVAFRHWQRDMRARGEKIDIAELTPPLPTNASIRVVSSAEAQSALPVAVVPQEFPSTMLPVGSGKARVVVSTPYWLDRDGRSNSWTELGPALEALRSQLPELRAVLTNRSIFVNLDYASGSAMPAMHLARYKGLVQALNAGAIYALHEGRHGEAFENLLAGTYAVDLARDEGTFLSQLVRVACAAILTSGLWEALQADGWTDAELAALQARWEHLGLMDSFVRSLAMERAIVGLEYAKARSSVHYLREATQGMPGPVGGSSPSADEEADGAIRLLLDKVMEVRQYVAMILWRYAWADQDKLYHHRELQRIIERGRQTAANRHWAQPIEPPKVRTAPPGKEEPEQSTLSAYDRARYWLALMVLPAMEKAEGKFVRGEVTRELAVAAIAIKRYQLKQGRLPSTLNALVPDLIAAGPQDWYDGKPLRYRANPDGTFLLYSIGENGVDDQGNSLDAKGERRSLLNPTALDVVWPQRATAEEVAAAEVESKARKTKGKR